MKYQSINDIEPVIIFIIQMKKNKKGEITRVEISRDLINKTNPFWVWFEEIIND